MVGDKVQKLIFTNSLGVSVEVSNTAPFILNSVDGIGNVGVILHSQKSPNQDGETLLGENLATRNVNIQGSILSSNVITQRRFLQTVFNPKLGQGTLTYIYGNIQKKARCIVDSTPAFPSGNQNKGHGYQRFLVNLIMHDPFWLDIEESKEEVAIWRGSFEFPLEIVEEGIELGYREPSLIVNIYNKGDVPCGMKIQFKALATVVNPSLFNVNTRQYFKLNKTMDAGEIITVTTHFQNKRVELNKNGITSNAFQFITDYNVTFLQLDTGDNLLRYDADEGIENMEVSIYYTPQYVGV